MVKCSEPIVVAHHCLSLKQRSRTQGQPTMITIKTAPVQGVGWMRDGVVVGDTLQYDYSLTETHTHTR